MPLPLENTVEPLVESPAPLPKLPPLVKMEISAAGRKGKAKAALYYQQNKPRILANNKAWQAANRDKRLAAKRRFQERNKERLRAQDKALRLLHPERYRASKAKYSASHVEELRAKRQATYWADPDKFRKRCQVYGHKNRKRINAQRKLREQNDPAYAIGERLRRQLVKAVHRRKTQKADSTMKLLGCPLPDFIRHIESQFVEGMSWSTRQKWELDHIKPIASFDMLNPDHQRECFHWTNLRPLWTDLNRSKSDKY